MEIYKHLPMCLLHRILEYTGIMKNRNGKYMTQIIDYDKYNKIKKVMQIKYKTTKEMITINNYFYSDIFFTKNSIGIIHDYKFWDNEYIISIYKDKLHCFFYKWKLWVTHLFFRFHLEDNIAQHSLMFHNLFIFGSEYDNRYYNIIKYKYN